MRATAIPELLPDDEARVRAVLALGDAPLSASQREDGLRARRFVDDVARAAEHRGFLKRGPARIREDAALARMKRAVETAEHYAERSRARIPLEAVGMFTGLDGHEKLADHVRGLTPAARAAFADALRSDPGRAAQALELELVSGPGAQPAREEARVVAGLIDRGSQLDATLKAVVERVGEILGVRRPTVKAVSAVLHARGAEVAAALATHRAEAVRRKGVVVPTEASIRACWNEQLTPVQRAIALALDPDLLADRTLGLGRDGAAALGRVC